MAQLTSTTISGNLSVIGNAIASKIIKIGGTSSQILMADGSTRLISELITDTGATSITTSGSGNAVTSGSYDATTRQITLNKGTTFVTGASSSNMTVSTSGGVITITHPTTTATTAGLYKIGKDALGHVVIGAAITPSDLGLSTVYKYKGTKTWAELKALTSAEIGDVYSITDKDPDGNTNADWACYTKVTAATGNNYANYWQSLGGKVDLSAYVQGPASSTNNAIAIFDGTTGKQIKNSGSTIDSNGYITTPRLLVTANSNTLTIGAQNASFCHIYNSANIPFIFNQGLQVTGNKDLGTSQYDWKDLYLSGSIKKVKSTSDNTTYTLTLPNKTGTIALTSDIPSLSNYVTLDTDQTITGNKTFTGNVITYNNKFEIKANSNTDDSWIKLTNKTDSGYYAFGIRRPYDTYGLQLKIHSADGTDAYYNIWHAGNDGSGSKLDADLLDGKHASEFALVGDYLPKTTYEWNKEFAADSNGAVSLGRYNIYDTQLTFDITTTTAFTLSGKLVIASQNGKIQKATIYGDASNTLANYLTIYQSAVTNNRSWIEVFCNFPGWSKNKVHIYGVALNSATVTNQMTSVTFTNGVPSGVTSGDSKWTGAIINDITTNCAAKNHTHDVNITTSTGTNELTLAYGTKYALTAGGQSFIFTMPTDSNTTYGADRGISLKDGKFGHSNTAVTAVTTAGLYKIKYDAYGHITGTESFTLPTVNNGTLTIQKNGTNVATFTANQSGNATANITVPTKVSELTNDSNFLKAESDTLQTVTNRGATTNKAITTAGLTTTSTLYITGTTGHREGIRIAPFGNLSSIWWNATGTQDYTTGQMWGITAYDKGYNLDATKTNTFRFRGPDSSTATSATDQMWINTLGLVTSRGGFAKSGSSDSYVLLAGGGTKAISDFAMDSEIPTVNNGTLTIQKNGTNVATFTANQSGNTTANIKVPDPANYYWANVKVSPTSSTATTPTVQKIGITGSTATDTAAAVTMEYDSTYKALKFVFA